MTVETLERLPARPEAYRPLNLRLQVVPAEVGEDGLPDVNHFAIEVASEIAEPLFPGRPLPPGAIAGFVGARGEGAQPCGKCDGERS